MAFNAFDVVVVPASSVVRMKLFTLDQQLVIRKAGLLAQQDREAVAAALRRLLGF